MIRTINIDERIAQMAKRDQNNGGFYEEPNGILTHVEAPPL
jgi:hypothetical protein